MVDASANLNQQIAGLRQSVADVQALANKALAVGDAPTAQRLAQQAVELAQQVAALQTARRDQAIDSQAWVTLNAHMDNLVQDARSTQTAMHDAQNTVATVNMVIALVGRLAAMA